MKSIKTIPLTAEQSTPFPKLMIYANTGYVYLVNVQHGKYNTTFIGSDDIVNGEDNVLGSHNTSDKLSPAYKDFDGTITLSNK